MLPLLSLLAVSLDIPANGSIVFVNDPVHLTDAAGTTRTVYGGFFPTATSLKIPDADAQGQYFNRTFPPICDRITVSTRPSASFVLHGGEVPVVCLWYIAHGTIVHFAVRTRESDYLLFHSIDGKLVRDSLSVGTRDVQISSDVLIRWHTAPGSNASVVDMRARQVDKMMPYQSNFTVTFVPGTGPEYFFLPPFIRRARGDHGNDFGWAVPVIVAGAAASAIATICVSCCCCARSARRCVQRRRDRAQRRNRHRRRAAPEDDAIPPVVPLIQPQQPYFAPYQYHLVQWPGQQQVCAVPV
jgi:hypothetical protein